MVEVHLDKGDELELTHTSFASDSESLGSPNLMLGNGLSQASNIFKDTFTSQSVVILLLDCQLC